MALQKGQKGHYPYALRKDYKKKLDKTIDAIHDGMKVESAVALGFGIYPKRWYYWIDEAMEDIENGINSTLVKTVLKIVQADAEAERSLSRRAREIALDSEDPSVEMLKFLLERRHGYKKKSAQEVEVSAPEDLSFNINITNSENKDGD